MAKFDNLIVFKFKIEKEHSSKSLQIIFDEINNEHPENITIGAFKNNQTVFWTEPLKVDSANFIYHNDALENTDRIIISFDDWNVPDRRARITEIGFDVPVGVITLENMYEEPKIKINPEIKAVEVTFTNISTNEKETYVLKNDVSDGKIYKINNPLIGSREQAHEVAEWILREESQNAEFIINWRQNPALEIWDKVGIENGYNATNPSNIIRQEFEYEGYLKGKTKTKGLI